MSTPEPQAADGPDFPWLYTAVDLITQCVMFMVLITTFGYSILSPLDSRSAVRADRASPAGQQETRQRRERRRLSRMLAQERLADSVRLVDEKGHLTLVLKNAIFFASGRADLKPAANTILMRLGAALSGEHRIRVEGYTDDVPIRTRLFPSNWELSAARAIAVLRALNQHGVAAGRLSAAGYGEFHPRFPNNSEVNRAANRRVEIVLVFAEDAPVVGSGGSDQQGGRP